MYNFHSYSIPLFELGKKEMGKKHYTDLQVEIGKNMISAEAEIHPSVTFHSDFAAALSLVALSRTRSSRPKISSALAPKPALLALLPAP